MPELQTLIKVAAILMAICLVLSIIFHMPRLTFTLVVMVVLVPILCTIMWGDGQKYVAKVASLFVPEIEQQINDSYSLYHDLNASDPVVDLDQVQSYMDAAKGTAKDGIAERVFPDR